jgi:hypothetical protein
MKTALMWIINYFFTCGMVSSWSMHGKLACPYCMENNKAFTLTNTGKAFFFIATCGSCQSIKSTKRIKIIFFVGRVERDVILPVLLGEELYDVVSQYNDIVFGFQFGKQKFSGFGVTYN